MRKCICVLRVYRTAVVAWPSGNVADDDSAHERSSRDESYAAEHVSALPRASVLRLRLGEIDWAPTGSVGHAIQGGQSNRMAFRRTRGGYGRPLRTLQPTRRRAAARPSPGMRPPSCGSCSTGPTSSSSAPCRSEAPTVEHGGHQRIPPTTGASRGLVRPGPPGVRAWNTSAVAYALTCGADDRADLRCRRADSSPRLVTASSRNRRSRTRNHDPAVGCASMRRHCRRLEVLRDLWAA